MKIDGKKAITLLKKQSKIIQDPNSSVSNLLKPSPSRVDIINNSMQSETNIANNNQNKLKSNKKIINQNLNNANTSYLLNEQSVNVYLNETNNNKNNKNSTKISSEEQKILENHPENEQKAKEARKIKKKNEVIINELSEIIGMIGRKLILTENYESDYQPWDCVTKKDNFMIAKCGGDLETRTKIVEYTKNSFLKVYPTKFNSDNYDTIKCWILGCQIASINIQKYDDINTLLNLIFFKQNNSTGYVLKPSRLRDKVNLYDVDYEKPVKRLNVELISGYMLNLLGFDPVQNAFIINLQNLVIEIFLVGSKKDDEQKGNKFEVLIKENLLNPHFANMKKTFDLYEPELSAIFIYVYSDKKIIGKSIIPLCMMGEGLRSVPLYDYFGEEFSESKLIFRFEFENIQDDK